MPVTHLGFSVGMMAMLSAIVENEGSLGGLRRKM